MRFSDRNGTEITSLDDWQRLGKPASSNHWKPGRSAYELAADWIERDAPEAVATLLSARPEFSGLQLVEGVAEKQTRFDQDFRGPRNHDLLLRGTLPDGPITIGVEAKGRRAFRRPAVALSREGAQAQRAQRRSRARRSAGLPVFSTSLERDRSEPALVNLGYQLFSALAGTLADAKLDGSSLAVVLVQEYVTDLTDDAKHCRNAGSFDQFLSRLIGPDAERTVTTDGWVTKPVPVAGDGTWCREQTDIAFAKLVRHLRRPRSPSSPTG